MENKNSSAVLTIIAVATLVVAIVGATFAYFQAQGGNAASANVNVATGTAASASFGTFQPININADQTTFGIGKGDATQTTSGTVKWTAPGATATSTPSVADRTFCYTVTFTISNNTFTKSTANTTNLNELEYTVSKGSTTIINKQTLVNMSTGVGVTGTINIPTTAGGNVYKHKLTADAGKTVSDTWSITVTLKNLSVDQQQNTGKAFAGVVQFAKTTC